MPRIAPKLKIASDAKMKELILYVAKSSEKDKKFGAVKLNKILFYADFLAYLKRGKSITGQEYFALDEGPAPKRLLPIREQMKADGEIVIKKVDQFGLPRPQERIEANRSPVLDGVFSADEIADVNYILQELRDKTGKDVTNMSHEFAGWKSAFSKGAKTTIPLSTVRFDPEGFLGIEMPPLPAHLIEYGKKLHRKTTGAAA